MESDFILNFSPSLKKRFDSSRRLGHITISGRPHVFTFASVFQMILLLLLESFLIISVVCGFL